MPVAVLSFLILLIPSTAESAKIKLKSGRKGKVTVVDTASLFDTLSCTVKLIGKNKNKAIDIEKSDIIYIIVGNDTLRSDQLYCTKLSRDDIYERRLFADDTCRLSYFKGQRAAANYNIAPAVVGSFGSGCLLGLIGTGIMTLSALVSPVTPRNIPDSVDVECFTYGYEKKVKKKRLGAAIGGSLLGTLVMVIVLLSLDSGTN